jgi:hypothetical protein
LRFLLVRCLECSLELLVARLWRHSPRALTPSCFAIPWQVYDPTRFLKEHPGGRRAHPIASHCALAGNAPACCVMQPDLPRRAMHCHSFPIVSNAGARRCAPLVRTRLLIGALNTPLAASRRACLVPLLRARRQGRHRGVQHHPLAARVGHAGRVRHRRAHGRRSAAAAGTAAAG